MSSTYDRLIKMTIFAAKITKGPFAGSGLIAIHKYEQTSCKTFYRYNGEPIRRSDFRICQEYGVLFSCTQKECTVGGICSLELVPLSDYDLHLQDANRFNFVFVGGFYPCVDGGSIVPVSRDGFALLDRGSLTEMSSLQ
jgi:hypothetical protein